MFDTNLFREAVGVTVQCWPSFQIAIKNGMGGPNVTEKVNWLCDCVVQMFAENREILMVDDLIDYLNEIIDHEFDTIIQDGSLEMVCSSIFTYHQHIRSDNKEFVINQLNSLKEKHAKVEYEDKSKTSTDASTSSANNESAGDVEMATNDTPAPQDDGWTVVNRKKR